MQNASNAEAGGRRAAISAAAAMGFAAVQTLAGMVLYAYLIRLLGASVVAVWVTLLAAGMLACMADLGLNHALVRLLAVRLQAGEPEQALSTVETLVWSATLFSGASLAILHLGFPLWQRWLSLPPDALREASALLPYMTVGLWLNRVSDALAGCLEGQQRFLSRSLAGSSGFLIGLVLSVVLAQRFGMQGAAAAFAIQNLWIAVANAVLAQRSLPSLRWWRPRLRAQTLKTAIRYGLSVQTLVFCFLLLESGAKLFLVGAGSLAAVSYFDIAFRIGKGLRGLLSSALRVLVPKLVAEAQVAGRQAATYAGSFALVLVVAAPIYVGLLTGAHLLSRVIVGHSDPTLVMAIVLGLFPWLAYCLIDPALNLALATGRMRLAMWGHALAVLLAALGMCVPALRSSWQGVYATVAVALVAGCAATLAGLQRTEGLPWRVLDPARSAAWLTGGAMVGAVGVVLPTSTGWPPAMAAVPVAALYAAWLFALWRSHPGARRMLALLRSALDRSVDQRAAKRRAGEAQA